MTEQKEARETAISYKKEFEKDLEICIEAMEAIRDDLELRRTRSSRNRRLAEKRGAVYGLSQAGGARRHLAT